MSGAADFARPLEAVEEKVCRDAGARMQATNRASLAAHQGPGGPVLPDNNPKYKRSRRKRGKPLGVLSGGMTAGMVDPAAVSIRVGGAEAEVVVPVTTTPHVFKAQTFLNGRREKGWRSGKTASGKRKAWQVEKIIPPRDFVGIDERDVEVIGEEAAEGIFRALGFR